MKKLVLTEAQKQCLAKIGYVEIQRGDFIICITRNDEEEDTNYSIHIANPYDEKWIDIQMYDWKLK
jgi:hypothetical protein